MSRIALFGGTFNPVHNGHINLCLECHKKLHFDKILLIPDNIPPHKSSDDLAGNAHRLNMLKIAAKENELFEVCDIEYKLKGTSYTVNTIAELKKIYKEDELFLIIGSDMLFMFDRWFCYEKILKSVTLVAGARKKDEYDAMVKYKEHFSKLKDKINILKINTLDISSSQIREKIKNGEATGEYINKEVLDYILKNKLYK